MKRTHDQVEDASIVPLSEQINAMFAPEKEHDPDALFLETDFAVPRGPMIDGDNEDEQYPRARKLGLKADIELDSKFGGKKSSRKELEMEYESSSSGDDDDEEEDDSDEEDSSLNVEGDDDDDEDGLQQMMLEEDEDEEDEAARNDEVLAAFHASQKKELKKAQHTETQNKLWHRLLAMRIKMQALVNGANTLPLPAQAADLELEEHSAALCESLTESLAQLTELRSSLLQNHPDFSSVRTSSRVPSDSEEWWEFLAEANASSVAAEEKVINVWNRQTNVQTGKAMRALGKGVVEQVRSSLVQDHAKLIRRTQLNRQKAMPFGSDAEVKPYEEEIFDDSEFYANLLKVFLQATGGGRAGASGAVSSSQNQKKRRAKSKSILNMQIQDKLLNFMAPLESNVLPPMADALFGSLFGQTPNLQPADNDEPSNH